MNQSEREYADDDEEEYGDEDEEDDDEEEEDVSGSNVNTALKK